MSVPQRISRSKSTHHLSTPFRMMISEASCHQRVHFIESITTATFFIRTRVHSFYFVVNFLLNYFLHSSPSGEANKLFSFIVCNDIAMLITYRAVSI